MADLVSTLTETLTLNGSTISSSNAKTIAVTEAFKRVIKVPANNDTTILKFNSSVHFNDGALDIENVKYIRITNTDGSNGVTLQLQIDTGADDSASDQSCSIRLEAGRHFILGTPKSSLIVDDDSPAYDAALRDLESIMVDSSTNEVILEIFVAG